MYNPSIAYRGPDGATRSLTNELTARDGTPSRPYEFVTGWKDAGNVSGHNPDSNGITHGVDIFTGNLRWTADHLAARGKAGDPRVLYVIYAGQLANARTGWSFAGEGWEHWDHVHLSVRDGYWGGPCTLPASIHNDTSSWGVVPISGQGSSITPIIQEDTLSAAEVNQIKEAIQQERITIVREIRAGNGAVGDTIRSEAYSQKVFAQATANSNGDRVIIDHRAQIAGLTEAIKQLATGAPMDLDEITEAARRGAEKAMAEGVVKVDISIDKPTPTEVGK